MSFGNPYTSPDFCDERDTVCPACADRRCRNGRTVVCLGLLTAVLVLIAAIIDRYPEVARIVRNWFSPPAASTELNEADPGDRPSSSSEKLEALRLRKGIAEEKRKTAEANRDAAETNKDVYVLGIQEANARERAAKAELELLRAKQELLQQEQAAPQNLHSDDGALDRAAPPVATDSGNGADQQAFVTTSDHERQYDWQIHKIKAGNLRFGRTPPNYYRDKVSRNNEERAAHYRANPPSDPDLRAQLKKRAVRFKDTVQAPDEPFEIEIGL